MLNRRFLGAFALCASLLASVPASALQCVPFARAESGVEIRGNAKTWWSQAAGEYDRGQEPRKGAVMAFAGTRGMGFLMQRMAMAFKAADLFAATAVVSILSIVVVLSLEHLNQRLSRWR